MLRRLLLVAVGSCGSPQPAPAQAIAAPASAPPPAPTIDAAPAIPRVDHLEGQRDGDVVMIVGTLVPGGHGGHPLRDPGSRHVIFVRPSGTPADSDTESVVVDTVPTCSGTVEITGKVVESRGPAHSSTGGRIYEPYVEWELDADRVTCR